MANQPKLQNGLTANMDRFVDYLLTNGGQQEKAAISAGYAPKTAGVKASELIKQDKIQQAISERANKHCKALVPMALNVVRELAVHGKSDSVRLAAAQDILNRSGMRAIAEPQLNQELTTKQQYNAILSEIRKALEQRERVINPDDESDTIATQSDSDSDKLLISNA